MEVSAKKNVLIIAVDDLRVELGCYGKAYMKTPNIDALANQGMLFNRMYCQQAICAPSRISMFSGMYPETTGIFDLHHKLSDALPDARTLPRIFKEDGYVTSSIGKTYHHHKDDPLGWSMLDNKLIGSNYAEEANITIRESYGFGPPVEGADVSDNGYNDGIHADRAISELKRLKDEAFFIAVGFNKPHLPFLAPKEYWDLYDRELISVPDDSKPINMSQFGLSNWDELRSYYGMPKTGNLTQDQTKELIHGYRACVSYIDAQVGKIMDELDRLNLRDNTIIVFWSDHGFKLGEYGCWSKHSNLEVDTRVPFFICDPDKSKGVTSDALVESVDILPTLAELCDVSIPESAEGFSLVPILSDAERTVRGNAYSVYPRKGKLGRAIRSGNYRYIEWRNLETSVLRDTELYDQSSSDIVTTNYASDPAYVHLINDFKQQLERRWDIAPIKIPGIIQAQDYVAQHGLVKELTSDNSGHQHVSEIYNEDWIEYSIEVPSTGTYKIEYRVASANGGDIEWSSNGHVLGQSTVSGTGDWEKWVTKSIDVELVKGKQFLKLKFRGDESELINLNWVYVVSTENANSNSTVLHLRNVNNNQWLQNSNGLIVSTDVFTDTDELKWKRIKFNNNFLLRNLASGKYLGCCENDNLPLELTTTDEKSQWQLMPIGDYFFIDNMWKMANGNKARLQVDDTNTMVLVEPSVNTGNSAMVGE